MNIEVCSKCRQRIDDDKKLDENVWNCPVCGLEEYETKNEDLFSKNFFDDIDKEDSYDALDTDNWRIGR